MRNAVPAATPKYDHNLSNLQSLTAKLPLLNELVSNKLGRTIEYDVDNGVCIGVGLLSQRDVAVQKNYLNKGAKFPPHSHPEIEILVVFHGELLISSSCGDKTLVVGDIIRFEPGTEHSCEAITDVWLIGITIPRSEGYPTVP